MYTGDNIDRTLCHRWLSHKPQIPLIFSSIVFVFILDSWSFQFSNVLENWNSLRSNWAIVSTTVKHGKQACMGASKKCIHPNHFSRQPSRIYATTRHGRCRQQQSGAAHCSLCKKLLLILALLPLMLLLLVPSMGVAGSSGHVASRSSVGSLPYAAIRHCLRQSNKKWSTMPFFLYFALIRSSRFCCTWQHHSTPTGRSGRRKGRSCEGAASGEMT